MIDYEVGDHVVCINDKFSASVRLLYRELPVEGQAYVVRGMRLGVLADNFKIGDVSVLLVGVNNDHAKSASGHEFGFRSDRFVRLQELKAKAVGEKFDELEKIGI